MFRAKGAQTVKLIAEYLDRALQFERMAEYSQDPKLREQLLQQSVAYRKLASKRALQLGLPPPDAEQTPPSS
jgi:hypothetical protein